MKIFSTFTGIGGFELGIEQANLKQWQRGIYKRGVEFVGYSEIDKYATQVYEKHFKGVRNYGDITKIKADSLPEFDCLVGGFPCQAFSIAGRRKGFDDTRGTLFFDLARILRAKRPRLFVFENVKGLVNHHNKETGVYTFPVIIQTLDELGYDTQWQVLNSKDFGVPQNRERIIIVGHLRGTARPKVFPITSSDNQAHQTDEVRIGTLRTHKSGNGFREMKSGLAPSLPARARNDGSGQPVILTGSPIYVDGKRTMKYATSETSPTILASQHKSGDTQPRVLIPEATQKGYAEAEVGDSINLKAINSPHGAKQNWDSYEIDGVIRRLTPMECERLQAFPDNWTKYAVGGGEISDTQRYKMCGNAVTTNVIQAVFERVFAQ